MHRGLPTPRSSAMLARLLTMTALLVACGGTSLTEPPTSGADARITRLAITGTVSFRAAAAIDPRPTETSAAGRVRVDVTLTNIGTSAAQLTYGDCWASVQVFATSGPMQNPLFENLGGNVDCLLWEREEVIGAGASTTASQTIDIDYLHGHGVPPGVYAMRVSFKANQELMRFDLGTITIP